MTEKNIKALLKPILGETPTINYAENGVIVLQVKHKGVRYCAGLHTDINYTKGQIKDTRNYLVKSIMRQQYKDVCLEIASDESWMSPEEAYLYLRFWETADDEMAIADAESTRWHSLILALVGGFVLGCVIQLMLT